MSQTKIWQLMFICGSIICIAVSAFVLGSTAFTTIIAVATLITGLINSLMSGSTQAANSSSWIVLRLRHILNVGIFLKIATIAIWICVSCFVVYGYYQSKIKNIEGIIIDVSGKPLENASVTAYIAEKKLTTVTTKGKFQFEKIDLTSIASKKLQLEVLWENIKKNETINLEKVDQDKISIVMQTMPPIRISYRLLGGHALDLLLKGQVEKKWDADLSTSHLVSSNDTLREMKNMASRFSSLFTRDFLFLEGDESKSESYADYIRKTNAPKLVQKSKNSKFLVGTGGDIEGPRFSFGVSDAEIKSIFTQEQSWNIAINKMSAEDARIRFWRFTDMPLMQHYMARSLKESGGNDGRDSESAKLISMYKYVCANYLPEDFAIACIDASFSPPGTTECGGGESGEVSAQLEMRELRLRVAIIENISSEAIPLKHFVVRKNNLLRLRTREEDEELQGKIKEENIKLYAPEMLLPKEKITIPLDIYFAFNKDAMSDSDYTSDTVDKLPKFVFDGSLKNMVSFLTTTGGYRVSKADLSRLYSSNKLIPSINKEFLWGPSMQIDAVTIGDVAYPFRKYDPKLVMVLSENDGIGSCPYIFTYSSESSSWQIESHILYGRSKKSKEGSDEIALSRFDGRILIKENDPEKSFVDELYIVERNLHGVKRILYPDNSLLQGKDGSYTELKQGDRLLLNFPGFKFNEGATYTLVARGYYLLYRYL